MTKQVGKKIKAKVDAKLADIWFYLLLRGLLALALAVCAFVWPEKTMGLLVKLLGAYFVLDGVTGAVGAYRSGERGIAVAPTVLSLGLGLVLLFWTAVSAKVFLVLVGVWVLLQGVGLWLRDREASNEETDRPIVTAVAVTMVVVGLVFIFWTDTTIVAVSWLLGIGLALIGGVLIYLATRLKRVRGRLEQVGKQA